MIIVWYGMMLVRMMIHYHLSCAVLMVYCISIIRLYMIH